MGRISGSFSGAGILNDIIVVIYSTNAPASEVARVLSTGPQGASFNYVFTSLPDATYIVKVHDSPDGTTLGNLRHDFWQDSKTNQVVKSTHWFTVDGGGTYDPLAGATVYSNPSLAGRQVAMIFQEGFRPLEPDVEVDFSDPENITLLGGLVFNSKQKWYMELAALVVVATPAGSSNFDAIETQVGNKTLTAADAGKTWMITSAGNTQVTTLDQLTTFGDAAGFIIVHDGGPLINLELKPFAGDTIRFRGSDIVVIYLGKGEMVKVVKKGIKWYVTDYTGQWDRIGHRIGVDAVPDNAVQANGTEYDGLIYKRLYLFVSQLNPSQLVTFATWSGSTTKQKFFAIDVVAKRIKVPDMQGMSIRFIKNIGGSDSDRVPNLAGMFQGWSVGPHTHPVKPPDANDRFGFGKTTTGNDGGESTGIEEYDTENNSGTENRVDNVGLLPVILI